MALQVARVTRANYMYEMKARWSYLKRLILYKELPRNSRIKNIMPALLVT